MPTPAVLPQSDIQSLPLIQRGKVRDIYQVDDQHLLIVTCDRISAFDVILPTAIPGKGAVLTAVSAFWFGETLNIIDNHLSTLRLDQVLTDPDEYQQVQGRAIIVRKLKPLPIEAIVRGYLVGSGWADYQNSGQVCGIDLPAGLEQAQQLAEPLFTPSTKAEVGDHDINISYAECVKLIGPDLAAQVRDVSIGLYQHAQALAAEHGILIADTKFEFGLDDNGALVLIDEILTPDSSRFWPADQYQTGTNPPSFDKQFVRDYLNSLDWDKTAPGPELPDDIVRKTALKYREAQDRLTQHLC